MLYNLKVYIVLGKELGILFVRLIVYYKPRAMTDFLTSGPFRVRHMHWKASWRLVISECAKRSGKLPDDWSFPNVPNSAESFLTIGPFRMCKTQRKASWRLALSDCTKLSGKLPDDWPFKLTDQISLLYMTVIRYIRRFLFYWSIFQVILRHFWVKRRPVEASPI